MKKNDDLIPEGAHEQVLNGMAADLQLLMAGHTMVEAYEALLPAMVNWCILAADTKEEAEGMARTVAVDLIRHVEAGYAHTKHQHAEMHSAPVTKPN